MPEPGSTRLGQAARPHAARRAAVARDIVVWTRAHGLDPHLNHLERFILRADDPRADDYSAFMGARAELVAGPRSARSAIRSRRSSRSASRRCRPSWRRSPRRAFAGVADVTISHPRFLEFVAPGVSKGRAVRWLARRLGRPARRDARHRRPVERHRDAGRGRPRGGDADRARAVRAVARYIAPPLGDEGVAAMIERLVLAARRGRGAASRALRRRRPSGRAPRGARRPRPRPDGPRSSPTTRPAGPSADRRASRRAASSRCPTDTVYGIAVALDTPGGIERLFAGEAAAARQGDRAAPRRRGPGGDARGHDAGRDGPRRRVLAGRPDARPPAAAGRRRCPTS